MMALLFVIDFIIAILIFGGYRRSAITLLLINLVLCIFMFRYHIPFIPSNISL